MIGRTMTKKKRKPYFSGISFICRRALSSLRAGGSRVRCAPFRYILRCLRGRTLSSGTSPERIAKESLTHLHSGFVHRNISRCPLMPALDQVWRSATRAGLASNSLRSQRGRSRIRSEEESSDESGSLVARCALASPSHTPLSFPPPLWGRVREGGSRGRQLRDLHHCINK